MTRKRGTLTLIGIVVLAVLALTGIFYYQATRFNAHITINQIEVGGLTAEQALKKLRATAFKNIIYVGTTKIMDGTDRKIEFSEDDLPEIKKIGREQRTFFPSLKAKDYYFIPSKADLNRTDSLEKELEDKLTEMNKGLQTPTDAAVRWEQGQIVVSPAENGQQYDIAGLMEEYQKQKFSYEIHLKPQYLKPIQANDPIILQEKDKLQELARRTVDYKVQDQVYPFQGSSLLKKATVSKDLTVKMEMDTDAVKKKLNEINETQSTLHKNYTFKTHSGSTLSVKGETYGWALDADAESKRIQEAFEKGNQSILAYNVYGIGWNVNGVGYHTTANQGIGNTYVEVSIQDQRIWVYKNGELKVTTPVVTGTHIYHEDTPVGVWYIEYKKSPSILQGSEVGNPNYSVKVDYWAPFTLSGDGFHDASWRTNWASDAYVEKGSGGCVNTPSSIMQTVYENLVQYEPVVIY